MAVTMNDPAWLDETTVRFSWSSGLSSPTFYIYKDGEYLYATALTALQFHVEPGEGVVLEVFDDPDDEASYADSGHKTLGWYESASADSYRVEEYYAAAWVTRKVVPDDSSGFYTYRTRFLEDVTTHQFRVIPISAAGNEGDPLAYSFLMVRHPDPVAVTYTWNAVGATFTIAEA